MSRKQTRRSFLLGSSALATGFFLPGLQGDRDKKPGEQKLRIGVVGVGGRGRANLQRVSGEHIVALSDVDARRLAAARDRFKDARAYPDFREMIAAGGLDAVVVSTPDHTHAPAAALALRQGLDVYCEKPLTHTVREARTLAELAREKGAVTQMGTQIHSWDNYRRVVEIVRSGALGDVEDVWVLCSKSWGGAKIPAKSGPEPAYLDWDLWLGPAEAIDYRDGLHPASWRKWWDFGSGTLGDMGCHYIDLAHWALELEHPVKVRAEGPEVDPEAAPAWLEVHWEHPAKGKRGPVRAHWHDGGKKPEALGELGLEEWRNGVLFVGTNGWLIADYTRYRIGPDRDFANYAPPPRSIPPSIGHHLEWIRACKRRTATTCHFAYSGALTETVLLGIVAYRSGETLEWDAKNLRVRNSERAQELVHKEYREGWSL
ncbi:MAG: Gfo/Idh/MocA family protein [Planctomycetota bacterium]